MRTPIRSFIALLAATSFVGGGVVEPFGGHECLHHDAIGGQLGHVVAAPSGDDTASGEDALHAHDAGSGSAHAAHGVAATGDSGTDHGEGHGPCTCIGDCGAAGSGMAPVTAPRVVLLPGVSRTPDLHPAQEAPVLAPVEHLLPLSNAPPSRI